MYTRVPAQSFLSFHACCRWRTARRSDKEAAAAAASDRQAAEAADARAAAEGEQRAHRSGEQFESLYAQMTSLRKYRQCTAGSSCGEPDYCCHNAQLDAVSCVPNVSSLFSHSRRSTKEAVRQWRDQKAEAAAAAAAAESAAAEQRAAEERARWEAEQRQRRASLQPFLSDKVAWCNATSQTNLLKTAVIQLGTSCNKFTRQARPTAPHLICRQPK